MGKEKAFDINGVEIKRNALVKVVTGTRSDHHWLKDGNTLRVAYWENRSFGHKAYIVVFLESKKGGKLCQQGLQDKSLMVVES